ncbi:hypothetical protein CB0940_12116 [Cercospora beticola]|nr:hypothetical protein CB0940_12116 [Cercospora beticola]PIA80033.1 hypothetical protein CB0940_12116 [Cercospora beticola]CAK1356589.1 unnamed protein product [Cercospora beticola]
MIQLSESYFQTVHLQYPFLNEATHRQHIERMYSNQHISSTQRFQIRMVLAISSTILSRRTRVELPANSWCAEATQAFVELQLESSLEGLQCLLLLVIYVMHSPASKLNAWHINYQCIAMVLDLGLQRDLGNNPYMSQYTKEMRTRVFWAVYCIDRKLSTMMGRPIGIRDEACDLRMPADIDDYHLSNPATQAVTHSTTHMTYAIHLFRLSTMISEIKYVLPSVRRDTPSHAFPAILDIYEWQDTMNTRLDEWYSQIPDANASERLEYGVALCKLHFHTIRTSLFMPSPGIPQPLLNSQRVWYRSSSQAIKTFSALHANDVLVHDWSTCHAIILHSFCITYFALAVPAIASEMQLGSVMANLRAASSILSAAGEYWVGAKRTRVILDDLAGKVLTALTNSREARTEVYSQSNGLQQPDGHRNVHEASPERAKQSLPDMLSQEFWTQDTSEQLGSWNPFADLFATDFDMSALFTNDMNFTAPTGSTGA